MASGVPVALEGDPRSFTALVEFPDIETAKAFHESEAYAPFKRLRNNSSTSSVVLLNGV